MRTRLTTLVLEYLEGETLDRRLRRGAIPLEQTLSYGIEIADALDRAHRQGVSHRDLKPGNIMLTKSAHQRYWVGALVGAILGTVIGGIATGLGWRKIPLR